MVPHRPLTFPIFIFMELAIILSAVRIRKVTVAVVSVAVKFTIKSFTVPELSVDLPESATVSNLKVSEEAFQAVLSALSNIFVLRVYHQYNHQSSVSSLLLSGKLLTSSGSVRS